MMPEYTYSNPENNGYEIKRLSRKNHNKIFPSWKINIFEKCDYYCKTENILIHKHFSILGKCVIVLIFPFNIVFYGIGNIKETYRNCIREIQHTKYGSFTPTPIRNDSDKYKQMVLCLE